MNKRDQQMETAMGHLLRTGVIVCCTIMAAGAVLFLLRDGGATSSYTHFAGEPADLKSIAGVLKQTRAGSARGIIQLGALLMIATPVLRVVFAVAGFAKMKDWKFTAISAVVLALLAYGLQASQ
jgi:uncharacterized membrane protein